MTKSSRYTQQIIITQAGTTKLGWANQVFDLSEVNLTLHCIRYYRTEFEEISYECTATRLRLRVNLGHFGRIMVQIKALTNRIFT